MERIFRKRCAFQTPILGAVVAAAIGVFSCAYFHFLPLLFIFLALSLFLLLWAHGVEIRNGFSFSSSDRKALLILLGGFSLLGLSILVRGIRTIALTGTFSAGILFAIPCFLLAAVELFCFRRSRPSVPSPERRRARLWDLGCLSLLALLLFVLNLEIFDAWIRWDSYDYYYYIDRLTPMTLTDLERLRLANHAAYAVSLLHLVADGLFGDYVVTIYTLNVVTLILGAFLFWRILRIHFPHQRIIVSLLLTLAFAFSPFTFGLVYTIGLEWYLMLGLLIFLWAEAEQVPLAQGLGMVMICFSKETGVVILFALMATKLLYDLRQHREKPFFQRVDLPLSLTALSLALIWVVDLFTFNWLASNQSPSSSSSVPFNQFAFEPVFIADRIKSILFTNFTWLLILLLLGGLVAYLRNRKRGAPAPCSAKAPFVAQLLAALGTSLLLTLLFVTYNHIRYAAPLVLLLLLLLPHAVNQLRPVALRAALCGILAACSLLQCYVTADPLMKLTFPSLNKGEGSLIYTDNRIIATDRSEPSTPTISVGTQYNREILAFDQALDRLLSQIEYDRNTCLIFSGEYIQPSLGYRVYTEYLILGFGYPYMETPRYMAWDREEQRRILITDGSQPRIQICYANSPRSIETTYQYFDRLVYIQLPFRDNGYEAMLLNGTTHHKIATENYRGWTLNALEITDVGE